MATSSNGLIINPNDNELMAMQTYAYSSGSDSSAVQAIQSLGSLFNAMSGTSVSTNLPKYINGFEITYSDEPTLDTGTLSNDYENNLEYHYFLVREGTALIDNQLVTFNESHIQVRVSTELSDDHPLKLKELDPNTDYAIVVKYINNEFFISDSANIHIVSQTEYNQPNNKQYMLKIGSFKTDSNRRVHSNKTVITQYEYSLLNAFDQTNYILVNDSYNVKDIDDQGLKALSMQNFKPFYENLNSSLINVLSENNLSNISLEKVPAESIHAYVSSGSFVYFDPLTGQYQTIYNKNQKIVGLYLESTSTNEGIIIYGGTITLDPLDYIIPSKLLNLIPGENYYIEPRTQELSPVNESDYLPIGYTLPGDKIILDFANPNQDNLDIFLSLFGSKEEVQSVLTNYYNQNKDQRDITKLKTLSTLLNFELDQIKLKLGEDVNDDLATALDNKLNELVNISEGSIVTNGELTIQLYLLIILSYLSGGISSVEEKTGYFNGAVDLDSELIYQISELLKIVGENLKSSNLGLDLESATTIAGAYGGGFENLVWDNQSSTVQFINALLYVSQANEGEILTIKISTDAPSNYNLDFMIHDKNGELGVCTVYAGNQTGLLQVPVRKDDVYNNESAKEIFIFSVEGPENDKVQYDQNNIIIQIKDTIDRTTLTFNKELMNYKEINSLQIIVNPMTESNVLSGKIVYLDETGTEISFPSDIDVNLVAYYNSIPEELLVNCLSGSMTSTFNFTITKSNDVYINDDIVKLTINEINGGEFNYNNDSKSIDIPFLDDLDNTICKLEKTNIDSLSGTSTYRISLSNTPETPFNFRFSSGEELTITFDDIGLVAGYPISKEITLNSLPDGYERFVDPINTSGGNFENVIFDETGLNLKNHLSLQISDVQEGNEARYIVRSTHTIMTPVSIPVLDKDDNIIVSVTIESGKRFGETIGDTIPDTNIADSTIKYAKLGDIINPNIDFEYVIDNDLKSYIVFDNPSEVFWSYSIDYINSQIVISSTQAIMYVGDSVDSEGNYLYENIFKIVSTDSVTDEVQTLGGFVKMDATTTSVVIDIDPNYLSTELEVANLSSPYEKFTKVQDIDLVIDEYIPPYNAISSTIYKYTYKYQYEYTIELSNQPSGTLILHLSDQFGNTKDIDMNDIQTVFSEFNSNIDLLPEYRLDSTEGGNFEFLEIVGLPQAIFYDGVDISLTTNGKIYESDSIMYIATITKALAEDIWIQLNNGEEIIIPAGRLSSSILSKQLNISEQFNDNSYISTTVVTNFIKSVNKPNIKVLNGYNNPVNTLIQDDFTVTKLDLTYQETEANVTYTVSLSDYPTENVIVILSNGAILTIPASTKLHSSTIPKDDIQNIENLDVLDQFLSTKKGKVFLIDALYDKLFSKFQTFKDYTNGLDDTDSLHLEKIEEEINYVDNLCYDQLQLEIEDYTELDSFINESILALETVIETRISHFKNRNDDIQIIKQLFEYYRDFAVPELKSSINELTNYEYQLEKRIKEVNDEISRLQINIQRYDNFDIEGIGYSIDLYKLTEYQRKIYNYNYIHLQIQTKYSEIDDLITEYKKVSASKIFNKNSETFSLQLDNFYSKQLEQIQYDQTSRKNLINKYIGEFNIYRSELGLEIVRYNERNYDPGPYIQNSLTFYK